MRRFGVREFFTDRGSFVQGHLEMSNTNVANELTKLMVSQQAFSASSRLMQSAIESEKRLLG